MKLYFFYLLVCFSTICRGQGHDEIKSDTTEVLQLLKTANTYNFSKADTGLKLAQQALDMARKINFKQGVARALNICGEAYNMLGDYPRSLQCQFESIAAFRKTGDQQGEADALSYIGILYIQLGQYREALNYFLSIQEVGRQNPDIWNDPFIFCNIGDIYDSLKMPDSALYYQKQAYALFPGVFRPHLRSFILRHMGNIYAEFGRNDSAIHYLRAAISNARLSSDNVNLSFALTEMADVYKSDHQYDSSLYYAKEAFLSAHNANAHLQLLDASTLLSSLYRNAGHYDSALFYADVAAANKNSLFGAEKYRQMQFLLLRQQQQEEAIREEGEQFKNRIKYIALFTALGIFLLLAFILIRNNRQKQKANTLLTTQKDVLDKSLAELKSTQAQLVQREKMASLGELTAGIAHEIQNPLNFINNFSELNKELLDELAGAKNSGQDTEVNELLVTLKENQEKIFHHGKRADAIVKGMLEHSRSSKGVTEPTEINMLADEYLRLAYRGFRIKPDSIDISIKTDYDNSIGRINIIPGDIGRVLLNIYHNAFYAMAEKKKHSQPGFEPELFVVTKRTNSDIEIKVRDNGTGVSSTSMDKIFQPFYTTKPTGEGTGLGLSISYDIVKAHEGLIKVNSREGEFTEFIILIPGA
jgi:two-component system, NtrC family, sensor kinase